MEARSRTSRARSPRSSRRDARRARRRRRRRAKTRRLRTRSNARAMRKRRRRRDFHPIDRLDGSRTKGINWRGRARYNPKARPREASLARAVSRRLSRDADLEFSARQVSRDSPRARRNSSRSDSPLFSDSVPSSPPCPWSFVSRISSSEATSFTRATTGTDRRRSSRPRSCSANRRWIR